MIDDLVQNHILLQAKISPFLTLKISNLKMLNLSLAISRAAEKLQMRNQNWLKHCVRSFLWITGTWCVDFFLRANADKKNAIISVDPSKKKTGGCASW